MCVCVRALLYSIYGGVTGVHTAYICWPNKRLDYLFDFGIIIIRRTHNTCKRNDCVCVCVFMRSRALYSVYTLNRSFGSFRSYLLSLSLARSLSPCML